MTARADHITVECPRCGACYDDWTLGSPELECDPALGDPGMIRAAADTTCPHCGETACCSGLATDRELWRG